METLDRHNQTHNDIKPQNFLVKFKNGPNDLSQIEIVLTDFGMADSDSKGGTPVFASPECFEKKEKKSDIFSFGRVILFLLLTKNQFAKWLFVPGMVEKERNICSRTLLLCYVLYEQVYFYSLSAFVPVKNQSNVSSVRNLVNLNRMMILVSKMTSLVDRISLQSARNIFDWLRQTKQIKLSNDLITSIDTIVNSELSSDFSVYVSELCDQR